MTQSFQNGNSMVAAGYVRRLAVMWFGAMPITALTLGLFELRTTAGRLDGFWNVISGSIGLVYFWGVLTAIPLSLLHTLALRALESRSWIVSVALGGFLGLIFG